MVPKHNGSTVLVGVSLFSLLLALSVYYVVDNIARPSDDTAHGNYLTEQNSESSGKQKIMHPLTEILYQQLFQKKPLGVCPVYLTKICRWKIYKHEDNETTEEKIYKNTTKDKLKEFNSIIRLCQVFGLIKYQDVCFYVQNSFFQVIPASRKASQILQDCAYINNNGYPCVVRSNTESQYLAPRNVCVSDSATAINVLTKRCRFRTETYRNNSEFMPLEDFIYEVENYSYRNEYGGKKGEISAEGANDNNQQYKSGSNKTKTGTSATTVVCHILLAALLVASASVALFEVCRDRLGDKKFGQQSIIGDGRINATGGRSFLLDNRRCSLVDLTVSRHARRESAQHQQQVIQQDCSNNNAGPSVAQRRPQTKLLGDRPPPLLRRSSFPVHIGAAASITHHSFTPKERVPTPSGTATPTKPSSRKASVDGSEGDSSPDMGKRRVRFLRRY
ncbi:hypothetical protein B7P43_G05870 [Cryptotermes secundus]|uniref:Uncharacterized protein n=1 Tax=Cryptotermes secundus TaxID=105785 RepID=A0A2J7R1C0_9NEOP|nr:uncharacterized protein LOC111864012 [Cryptotermes secundus]PNF34627.1 hypothetical protein B7P43_G05870 [Cryptotermes secundus]